MKVALIGLRLSVGNRLMVDTLADAFLRLGVEVVVVGERSYRAPDGVTVAGVSDGASYPAMFRDSLRPGFYRAAADALAEARPDVCYFVSVHPANALLAWAIRRQVRTDDGRRPAIAMHLHDPLPHPGAASAIIFLTQQLQTRFADRIVVYGDELARQVHRYYRVPRRRITTIRHGAYRAGRDTPPADGAGFQWFSFLGRIEPYKGLDVFLGAALQLRASDPACRFYVGGAGDIAPYRDQLGALGDSLVLDHRELTNAETDSVMQASWAVVLPYASATQSGVIPIAYWNACPVIATRVGALGEVVREGQTGFIVERGDVDAVADRMRALRGNAPLRWRLGGEAFSFYDRWLRWERIASDLLNAIR